MKDNNLKGGAKTWYFPDGYLPEQTDGKLEAHEAIMIMNVNQETANIKMDLFFEDKDPVKDIQIEVGSERVLSVNLTVSKNTGGYKIPALTQYAVRLTSNVPVVAMFGRLDTTQTNMAYYTVSSFNE